MRQRVGGRDSLDGLDWSKGTIRFQPEHPLPDSLLTKLVLLRRDEIDATGARGSGRE